MAVGCIGELREESSSEFRNPLRIIASPQTTRSTATDFSATLR